MKHYQSRYAIALLSLLASLILVGATANAKTYRYVDFVHQLTDLGQLAERPEPGEKTVLVSSYDRSSRYDSTTDKYVNWPADADGNGVMRKEGGSLVLADVQGPGCIVRIWTAQIGKGHVRIFLDGNDTPAVDLPFGGYFDCMNEPFIQPALVYKVYAGESGYNNYVPIPFQKSCKIVADPDWGRYYQFSFRQFAAGTVVPTFDRHLSPEDTAALVQANTVLSHCGIDSSPLPQQKIEKLTVTIPAGKSVTVFDQDGGGIITGLRAKFELPRDPEAQKTLLRQLALKMTWDGRPQPAVWSPWGDFFADSGGAAPFTSLPAGLGNDGYWYSYWRMPFASHATISVDNDSPDPVNMSWEVTHAPFPGPSGNFLRFHAKWHRDAFLPTREDRRIDWPLVITQGQGRYVGTQLDVWNPRGGWWGEGDDKFFVDGEKFPSLFGTGSEDYFGTAWGIGPFVKAVHGATAIAPQNRGNVSAYRWHIADNVPFQTSFEGDIEKYYANESPMFTKYAAVAFWYLDPKGTDPYPVVPIAERTGYKVSPPISHEPGTIEAEEMSILQQQPKDSVQRWDALFLSLPPSTVSNDKLVIWRMQRIGQKVELGFKVAAPGKYRLIARIMRRNNGGIFQLAVNGNNVGAPVDFYGKAEKGQIETTHFSGGAFSFATLVDPMDLGMVELAAGDAILSATLTATNPDIWKDGDNIDFYLDYIKLLPVP